MINQIIIFELQVKLENFFSFYWLQSCGNIRFLLMLSHSFDISVNDLDFDDFFMKKNYNKQTVYGNTKVANILFTRLLASKLKGQFISVYQVLSYKEICIPSPTKTFYHLPKTFFFTKTFCSELILFESCSELLKVFTGDI